MPARLCNGAVLADVQTLKCGSIIPMGCAVTARAACAYRHPPNHDVVAHDVGEEHDGGGHRSLKRLDRHECGSGCRHCVCS